MDNPLSILLIEDDPEACEELRGCIDAAEDMQLLDIVNNSFVALDIVQEIIPDVIILDLELQLGGGNGVIFLSRLNQLNLMKRPYILITTNNSSNTTFDSVRALGADFILGKYERGYCAQYVVEFLHAMKGAIQSQLLAIPNVSADPSPSPASETREKTIIHAIHRELERIQMSPKLLGYKYLTDAIYMKIENHEGNLIADISKKYKKSPTSVERAIQNSIGRVWANSSDRLLKMNYTARISEHRGMPTTMEFVYYYANKIQDEL